jgi:hypothetical protein
MSVNDMKEHISTTLISFDCFMSGFAYQEFLCEYYSLNKYLHRKTGDHQLRKFFQ